MNIQETHVRIILNQHPKWTLRELGSLPRRNELPELRARLQQRCTPLPYKTPRDMTRLANRFSIFKNIYFDRSAHIIIVAVDFVTILVIFNFIACYIK